MYTQYKIYNAIYIQYSVQELLSAREISVFGKYFLICCPACQSCPVNVIQISQATWAILAAINLSHSFVSAFISYVKSSRLTHRYKVAQACNSTTVCHKTGTHGGGKVNMLAHIHTHTNPEEDLSGHMQSPGWQPIILAAWCLLWWITNIERSVVIHDTEYPCWDQVSSNNTNSQKNCSTSVLCSLSPNHMAVITKPPKNEPVN